MTPVYSEDRQFYDCGCVVHGEDGTISVIFIRYKSTGGIVGRCKPSQEMAGWLKQYGRELKEYIRAKDERERERLSKGKAWNRKISMRPGVRSKNLSYYPPPGVGSEKTKRTNTGNGKGQRNLLTNEK
jgi:hypothetical protein